MTAPVPLRLRPLEIGDVLDETFRMYRRHFLLLAGVSVVFSIPLAAVAGFGFFTFFSQIVSQASSNTAPDMSSFGPLFVALGLGTLVNLLLTPVQYGAVAYAVCESALGHPVTLWSALRAALRKYLHLAAFLLLAVLMGFAFCLFPLWIWILVGWIAVIPAIFIEDVGIGQAMGRSWRLVQGMWWRTFLIIFLIFVLNYVVSAALGAFLYLAQILLSIFLSPYVAAGVYEGGVIVASALTFPILQIALVLIYFDLRVRKEGLDLMQMAQRVAALPPAPA